MIIELELQQFIKSIEDKLPKLKGKTKEEALDKINVLKMAIKEIRELNDEVHNLCKAVDNVSLRELKLIQENLSLINTNTELENQLEQIKLNLNNYDGRD